MTTHPDFWLLAVAALVLCVCLLVWVVRGGASKWAFASIAGALVARLAGGWLRVWHWLLANARSLQWVLLQSARARYQQSWVIFLGQAGAGKTSLLASLERVRQDPSCVRAGLPGTTWIHLPQALLIDPQGRLSAAPVDTPEAAGWRSVLKGLLQLRPERALDAVVLLVNARSVLGADEAQWRPVAMDARRQLDDLRRELGLALPVYLVVSQCDAVEGLGAFWQSSGPLQRQGIFGWSAPDSVASHGAEACLDMAFAELGARLQSLQVDIAASTATLQQADAFFLFPQRFAALHAPLRGFAAELFQDPVEGPAFALRGVYFTACAQTPVTPSDAPRADISFADDLIRHKVLRERGLARAASVSLWSRDQGMRNLQRACVALLLALGLALGVSAWRLEHKVTALSTAMAALQQTQALAATGSTCTAKPLLDEVLERATAMDNDLVFGALPMSWVDPRASQQAVQLVSQLVMARTVFPAMACALTQRGNALVDGPPDTAEATLAGIAVGNSAYAKNRANLIAHARAIRDWQDNVRRFERLAAVPDDSMGRKLEAFEALYAYLYGAALPTRATAAGGMVAQSLAHVPYTVALDAAPRVRSSTAQQLGQATHQLRAELLQEVAVGPQLLSALDGVPNPALPENARRFTSWLVWVGQAWLPSDSVNNPCANDARELQALFTSLVKNHAYPEALLNNLADFQPAGCYTPAMRLLRGMQLSPYGPLLVPEGKSQVLNPALAGEVRGFTALLAQSYMQVSNPQSFACVSGASGWRATDIGRALSFAAEYQRFSTAQGLEPLGTAPAKRPLFDRVAAAQLERVMNDAMRSAQVPAGLALPPQGLDAVSVADQQLLQQSTDFARALEPLVSSLRLYGQLGFATSAARVSQCARDYASTALTQVSSLVVSSRLYEPEAGPSDGLLVNLGSTALIRSYLERQLARAQVLTGYADPFVNLLRNTNGTTYATTMAQWSSTISELTRYVQFKEPGGQVGALDTLFYKTLADMGYANCGKTLAGYQPEPYGDDMFSVRRRKLLEQLSLRCVDRRTEQATSGYRQLADRFTAELAGRYPFGDLNSILGDASLAKTKAFFADYAAQRDALQQALNNLNAPAWVAPARSFLAQLDAVDQFLRPVLGLSGPPQALKLDVGFRLNAKASPGSEQVVSWVLTSGDRVLSYPGIKPNTLDWSPGQVLVLDLNWAERSQWRPATAPAVTGYSAEGSTASFADASDWALLRWIERYQPKPALPTDPQNPGRVMLQFQVPTQRLDGSASATPSAQARFFMGLNLSGIDPKSQAAVPLRWPGSFPKAAP